ncbi:DNA double-strand break repair ATPase Rad50 [Halovivax gelatinilyticus]|uniref:DNA double-strand break repair ATPase Rad50 n=1 Tax=Halovivax gelatinilyticus TaxID=2961597 RepID=UPI0020CA63A2|nr:DNA double-strand break repair ATPase Rad50 [Halovivax gelatinilyticus]
MKVTRLALGNFKCYEEAELSLASGVTVVHGVNGSGKSTLLEAVFFALYGSKALDDRTLADVVTTGADASEVSLTFTHAGDSYRLDRHLSRRDDRATTTKCTLETPDGTIDGARDVRAYVTDLLRMDATAFVNCAYVRQGEVNKLIHASPGERQDMIDELLQLGALETYRERASEARLGVSDVLDEVRGEASTLDEQIESKAQKELPERLNALETELSDVESEIDRFDEQRESALETKANAQEVIDSHEETRTELEELTETIDDLREKITQTESERSDAADRLSTLESRRRELDEEIETIRSSIEGDLSDESAIVDRLESLEARDDALRNELEEKRLAISETKGTIEQRRERADQLEADATNAREEAAELTEKIETEREAIDERVSKLEALDEELQTHRERFEDAPVEPGGAEALLESLTEERSERREELSERNAERKTVETSIEEAEALLEAGKCPECAQSVEESPHVSHLDDDRERLSTIEAECESIEETIDELSDRIDQAEQLRDAERRIDRLGENRESISQLLAEKREAVEERVEKRESLLEATEEYDASASKRREEADELESSIETLRDELGELNKRRADVRDTRERVETLRSTLTSREDVRREIESIRERRADWKTMNDERRSQLSTARERRSELESAFDESRIEAARSDRQKAESYIERVDEKLATLRSRRDELQNAIGAVENELDELSSLRDRRESVDDRLDSLEALYDEAHSLQELYADLRAELRQRNVETLERMLNETFELIYQNDSYAGIDLDGSYRLTVYQKDGEPLDPDQLSGGERALFNLSLRCAIYRLLAEGVEGSAPLPPLILDEPTVFLDSGHVSQLVSLVETMRGLGVEQIVLVSHDEELVGAADDLVHVRKDATTNRSTIETRDPNEADRVLASLSE